MDGQHPPLRPPEYALPSYSDVDDPMPAGMPGHGSAVRLLTSMEEEDPFDSRPYVVPRTLFPPPPLPLPLRPAAARLGPDSATTPEPRRGGTGPQQAATRMAEHAPTGSRAATTTVKLQRRTPPEPPAPAVIAESLPVIPEGPSPRKLSRLRARCESEPPRGEEHRQQAAPSPSTSSQQCRHHRTRTRQSYEPSIDSRQSSILDPPVMALPPEPPFGAYSPTVDSSLPPRPWSPPRPSSEYGRPPPPVANRYEPADLNGSPRPSTPASTTYGSSNPARRPLPPAPLFTAVPHGSTHSFADDATVSIPLAEDTDDVYGPESILGDDSRQHSEYAQSQVTLSDGATDVTASEKVERYGPAPEGKQERRGVRAPQMSKKEVQLINGELVLECKIPTILYSFLPRRDEIEFTHMRYTAVTCDPDDFVARGYKLRQNIGRTARETELFICITMYNEDEYNFTRTMYAVMKNISHFCSRTRSRTWGELGWQKIVVCIVSDGRDKIHPRTLDALAAMGVYQHGIAKNYVNQKAVQAHVYEYTTQVSLDSDLKFKGAEKGIVPCQIIFCLKEKNQKKLNSHRWFFNAFGKALNPNVCILLDVGTRPANTALYHLWKAFDTDSSVAGACGEIKAMKGKWGRNLLNPLVASQNFEYKLSNILDKPLESVFGYITVLPGALSAYRFHALQNDETGHGPLSQYFKGETLHGQHADVFTANMYLAEDRILCWELVAKRGERWVLKYVKGCTGETDVPGEFFFFFFL